MSKKNVPLTLLSLALVSMMIGVTYLYAKVQIIDNQSTTATPTPTPTPTVSPTATPTVKGSTTTKTQPTVDSDPIITCYISTECGGGSKQLRKSECDNKVCCLIDQRCGGPKFVTKNECNNSHCCLLRDGTAKLLPSKSACDSYYTPSSVPNSAVIDIPRYPPCTVYYAALGYSQTYYYTPPEQCGQWQKDAASTYTPYVEPTTPEPTTTTYVPQITKSQCQQDVNEKYRSLMVVKYGCYYPCPDEGDCGSTSVCEALWYQVQKEMNACDQYP